MCAALLSMSCSTPAPEPLKLSEMPALDTNRVLADIRRLSSDEFEGRAPGSKGEDLTVDFIIDRLPEIPAVPYAEQIPTPAELVNNQYKFAKSLIDTNKDIALAVAKAVAPITDKALDRKAPRTVAKKTTVKKAS